MQTQPRIVGFESNRLIEGGVRLVHAPGPGERNDTAESLVIEIDGVMGEAGDGSLAVSSLTRTNNRLREVLEALLCFVEDVNGRPGYEAMDAVRRPAYRHLREVSLRGWSFFDVSGFRERIPKARAELSE